MSGLLLFYSIMAVICCFVSVGFEYEQWPGGVLPFLWRVVIYSMLIGIFWVPFSLFEIGVALRKNT